MKNRTKYNTRDVNTSNLSEGLVVKNYKEMCKLLGEEEAYPATRKTQMENWQRFFQYSKQGHKFIIEKIFDTPYDFQLTELGKSVFAANGQYFIMRLLKEECIEKGTPYLLVPRNTLYQALCLINRRYIYHHKFRKQFRKKLNNISIDVSSKQVNTAFELCDDRCYAILDNTLKTMRYKTLIKWEKVYYIDKGDGNGYVEETVETYIDKTTGKEYKVRVDEDIILSAVDTVLYDYKEQGIINRIDFREIIRKRLFEPFYKEVNDILYQEKGWVGCFKVYKITPRNIDTWDSIMNLYKEEAEVYAQQMRDRYYEKIKEDCEELLKTEEDKKVIDLLVVYLLEYPPMTDDVFQSLYLDCIEELKELSKSGFKGEIWSKKDTTIDEQDDIDNTNDADLTDLTDPTDPNNTWDSPTDSTPTPIPASTTPIKKQKEEKSMSKTSKPILTTTHEPTYTQSDYSDIPDDWEQIYESLEREDRECEQAMRKLEEQEQSKHKPVNTEMFTAMFGAQGDAHTQENVQENAQAVDISNSLDFSEEKCESESTDSAYASVQFGASAYRGDDYSWNDIDVVDRPDRKVSEFEEYDIRSMAGSI